MTKYFITYVVNDIVDYGFSEGEDMYEAIRKFCDENPSKIEKMYVCALSHVYKPCMENYYARDDYDH